MTQINIIKLTCYPNLAVRNLIFENMTAIMFSFLGKNHPAKRYEVYLKSLSNCCLESDSLYFNSDVLTKAGYGAARVIFEKKLNKIDKQKLDYLYND